MAQDWFDSGATVCLVTSWLANTLCAQKIHQPMQLSGLVSLSLNKHAVNITLSSTYHTQDDQCSITCQVFNGRIPITTPNLGPVQRFTFLWVKDLADWSSESTVNLILSVEDVHDCYTTELCRSSEYKVEAWNSIFGWVIRGAAEHSEVAPQVFKVTPAKDWMDKMLKQYIGKSRSFTLPSLP